VGTNLNATAFAIRPKLNEYRSSSSTLHT